MGTRSTNEPTIYPSIEKYALIVPHRHYLY